VVVKTKSSFNSFKWTVWNVCKHGLVVETLCGFIVLFQYYSCHTVCLATTDFTLFNLWPLISTILGPLILYCRGLLDTTLCDKVCQWLATGRWFSLCTLVYSINKTDRHNITEMLLKVALNTIKQTKPYSQTSWPLISPYLTTDLTLFYYHWFFFHCLTTTDVNPT
jgi:hypothetical protein